MVETRQRQSKPEPEGADVSGPDVASMGEEEFDARVEERTLELTRQLLVADGLREILTVLNSDRSLDGILADIVGQASRLLGARAAAVYRLERGAGRLVIQAAHGLPDSRSDKANISFSEPKIARAAAEHQPFLHCDLHQENVTRGDPFYARREWLVASGFLAVLGVPLVAGDEFYGILALYYDAPRRFPEDDVRLAVTVGEHVALAVENARTRSQAQMAAVAAERDRIARDLHDSVTQTLFSACLIAEVLPHLWLRNRDEGRRRLDELISLTRGALAEMRTLLLELHPSSIADTPLCDLLRQLADGIAARAQLPIRMDIDCECGDLPTDVKIVLYRTAQEALNNVARHARASEATIRLRCRTEGLKLLIADNGCGFDSETFEPDHLGLSIMRERSHDIGASIAIESEINRGSSVTVEWRRP